MKCQWRWAVFAVAVATTLSACSDGSNTLTGVNSVSDTASDSVNAGNGFTLAADNPINFPIAGALPLPDATDEIGAVVPVNASNDGVLGSEPLNDAPASSGAQSINSAAQTDFFRPRTALTAVDRNAQFLTSLVASITNVITREFVSGSGAPVDFSDDTFEISKRIADKTSCDTGYVESSFEMNGTQVLDGSVIFNDCGSLGYTLNGDVVMGTQDRDNGTLLLIDLRSVSATYNDSSSVFNGELAIEFTGESFRLVSDVIDLNIDGERSQLTSIDLTGLNAANGSRTLSGVTTIQNVDSEESVEYTFADVSVLNGSRVPSSGTSTLIHTDESRIEFDFDTGDPDTFMYTITQSDVDEFTTTFLEAWENVGFRVPLP